MSSNNSLYLLDNVVAAASGGGIHLEFCIIIAAVACWGPEYFLKSDCAQFRILLFVITDIPRLYAIDCIIFGESVKLKRECGYSSLSKLSYP